MLFSVCSCVSSNQFKSHCIIQAFFIDNVSNSIFFSAFDITILQLFYLVTRYDFNRIPFSNHIFFPSCDFFCFCIIVSSQSLETFCQFAIELAIVIIQLTLHGIMRSNLCDRILHHFDPAFRISLLITCIIQRKDFSFKNTVNSSSIQLILMFLILVSTFFSQRPTCTFTVTFQPPSV